MNKKIQKTHKKTQSNLVDYYPNRVGFFVAVTGAVSLTILGLLAAYA